MNSKLKYTAPLTLLGTSLLVWAALHGPYYVGAAGPQWGQHTHAYDKGSEYDAAESVFTAFIKPAIASPTDRINAIRNDYLRIIYYDNVVVDFKIESFDQHINLKFVKIQPNAEAPAPTPARKIKVEQGECGPRASSYITRTTYDTGYWGESQGTRPNPDGGLPIVYTQASWISTGSVTVAKTETCK